MAIDPEDKSGMLGCLTGLLAIGGVIGAVVWFSQQDFSSDPRAAAADKRSGTALTHVDPMREKTVVHKAVQVGPTSKRVSTEDAKDDDGRDRGVTAAVQNLGQMTDTEPRHMPEVTRVYDRVLKSEPLCYKGRIARRVPSLFTQAGFAVTYGADDYNSGDPLPRLEVFFDNPDYPVSASYLSMTHRSLDDFPPREVPVDYSETALSAVIAKWIAAVATETCPDAAPTSTPAAADGSLVD